MTASEAIALSKAAVRRRFHRWEMGVDGAIHAAAILAGLIGAVALIIIAAHRGSGTDIAAVTIYSAGLLAMFGCSAAYNLGRYTRHVDILHRLDHVGIFFMIAGTYTPFTVIGLQGAWSWSLTSIVWSLAGLGILLRLVHGRLFARLSVGLYLVLGWLGLVAVLPLVHVLDTPALVLLGTGGILYTLGIVFHLWERLPFQAAIWHGFVVAAAALHFAAVVILSVVGPTGGPA